MKTIISIVIFSLVLTHNVFSQDKIKINKFPLEYFVIHNFDFRYINELTKLNDEKNLTLAYDALINNLSDDKNIVDFIKYIKEARKVIKNNQIKWAFNTPENIYNIMKDYFNKGKMIDEYIPFIINSGLIESEGGTLTRNQLLSSLKKEDNDIKITQLIKSNNDTFRFIVYGYKFGKESNKGNPIIFVIGKINSKLYPVLNNKYELQLVLFSNRNIEIDEIKNFDLNAASFDQNILYGVIEHNYKYNIDEKYQSKVNNLRLRSKDTMNNTEIVKLLAKDEIVIVQETGKYEVIDYLPGNWIKVKTLDDKVGWCFGAYLKNYYDQDEMP